MRTLVLLLMIALLPLRAWVADGMSVRMAQAELAQSAGVIDGDMAVHASSMPEDCPMLAKAATNSDAGDNAAQSASPCFACHLSAASAPVAFAGLPRGPAPTAPPSWSATRYASADLARDLRPPIS